MIIGGIFGALAPAELLSLTREFLHEQRRYESGPQILRTAEGAALGGMASGAASQSVAVIGHCVIAIDARLDNREELVNRTDGRRASLTDAELLLTLWLQSGEKFLSWIAGDFALAIVDSRANSLVLARDVTGQRPIFYARTDKGTAFASMAAGLRPFLAKLRVDRVSLAISATNLPDDSDRSCFEGIRRVRPGEIVHFDNAQRTRKNFYWQPSIDAPSHGNRSALVAEYRDLLDTAVAARIRGCSRPVAAHLSGGFDSSSVAATAARLLGAPDAMVGLTSAPGFETPPESPFGYFSDESAIAAEVAAMHGFRHIVVRDLPPIAAVIRTQGPILQRPATNPFNLAWWRQIGDQASGLGATCLLTGELGNLTLNAGNLSELSEWVRRRHWSTWLTQARAAARRPDTKWRGVLFNSFGPWLPAPLWHTLQRVFLDLRREMQISFVRPEWRQKIEEPPYQSSTNSYAERLALIRQADFADLRKAALASNGIQESDPFSDRRVIEFSLRLPPDQLYWDGVSRPLMRKALADRLPRAVFDLFGRGRQAADWAARFTRQDAFELLEEISGCETARDLLDIGRMRSAIQKWPEDDWNRISAVQEYRIALTDALATGMFAAAYD